MIPGNPATLSLLAAHFSNVAETAAEAHARLAGMSCVSWTGEGAAAFARHQSGELPAQLQKLENSFSVAARGVRLYAGQLEHAQAELSRLRRQADAVSARQSEAAAAAAAAARQERSARAKAASATDPATHAAAVKDSTAARTRRASAQGRVDGAASELRALASKAAAVVEQHEADARTCAARIEAAGDVGIRNSFGSWASTKVDELREHVWVIDAVTEAIENVAAVVIVAGLIVTPFFPPLGGALLTIGGAVAVVGLLGTVVSLSLKNTDRNDMRSDAERDRDNRDAIFAFATFGAGKAVSRIGRKAYVAALPRSVSTPGKRIYINAARRDEMRALEKRRDAAAEKATDIGGAGVQKGTDAALDSDPAPLVPCVVPASGGLGQGGRYRLRPTLA